MSTRRLTTAQALVEFLAAQHIDRDGHRQRFVAGCFGIFGHGNVAGVGQALQQAGDHLPYHQARNEQAMVHTATAYARMANRLSIFACTSSIGPGATNMVTGAALATVNRLPVLLLPGDLFASRLPRPVLQQLEHPGNPDVSVNDAFQPVSRYWDRINRPEQLVWSAVEAIRVLTDPAETGAVTLCLPQDVQAEAYDWPEELFAARTWHIRRPQPDSASVAAAVDRIRAARRPLIVAGGGVIYSAATDALRAFVDATGVPVCETQAGKGSLPYDHSLNLGAAGVTGTYGAVELATEADLVIGVGTRFTDFMTASQTAFAHPDVQFVTVNVGAFDAHKLSALPLVGDARVTLQALTEALADWSVDDEYRRRASEAQRAWDEEVTRIYAGEHIDVDGLSQAEVIGAVNEVAAPTDVVVCAAGSMPGELHKLWRTQDPKGYHVEYGYSCMGYEIAGGLGIKLAAPDREVFVMCGDGSYLMLAQELVTAIAERVKLIVVLVDNAGYASIGALSESVGSDGFGTRYRYRTDDGLFEGEPLPVDLAANAASLGADVIRARGLDELRDALKTARDADRTTVVYVPTAREPSVPSADAFWAVPVAQVSEAEPVRAASEQYAEQARTMRHHL